MAGGTPLSGKYTAYHDYKDSGVEWLGEIPSEWIVLRYKNVLKITQGMAFKSSEYVDDSSVVNIRMGNIKKGGNIDLKHNNKYLPESYKDIYGAYELHEGDAIIAMTDMSPTLDFLAVPAILEGLDEGVSYLLNQRVGKLLLDKDFDIRFIRYLLLSDELRIQLKAKGLGTVQANMSNDDLYNSYFFCPTTKERLKIANFLDHETAKIDTLIDKQQQLITLLKEKRQAVISHAVTKGLNPNAPMRDSGVEWLGEVPVHWEVKQAKYVADITRGAILRPVDAPEYFDENGEWAYLNISDATRCDKYLYKSKLYLSQLGSTKSARVYPDNVIITASATIGKAFINKIKVCIHDGFIPFCNLKVDKSYLYHYLSNPFLYAAMGKSNTQKNIYLDEVKNMVVTVPPDQEQIAIVEHIEKSAIIFDGLIDKAEKAILLMQERRTALISAAVTGKIDVRNWQAPVTTNNNKEVAA